MKRITYVKIAGKNYPMSFSLGASKKIVEKYGSAEKMKTFLEKSKDSRKIDIVVDLLSLLIAQGCAYKNYFEKDIPTNKDDPVVDGKWQPIPKDVLEIAIGLEDIETLVEKINACINFGSKKEIEAISESKNTNGGQE